MFYISIVSNTHGVTQNKLIFDASHLVDSSVIEVFLFLHSFCIIYMKNERTIVNIKLANEVERHSFLYNFTDEP